MGSRSRLFTPERRRHQDKLENNISATNEQDQLLAMLQEVDNLN
jgi:hypothetical protein